MRAALWSFIVVSALTGCFASRPPDNVDFGAAQSLRDLEGTYWNLGEFDPKQTPAAYLSKIIWPGLEESRHRSIQTIVVRAMGDTGLSVQALSSSGVAKEQAFVRGKDFEFSGGRLRLGSYWENSLKEPEAGGLFFAHTTKELGVDRKGQGKYKSRQTVAGAAYLVVPVAMSQTNEVRFVRIGDK